MLFMILQRNVPKKKTLLRTKIPTTSHELEIFEYFLNL